MKRYHFSLGNSSRGAVGFCAAVDAKSKKEAVQILKDLLPDELPGDEYCQDEIGGGYIRVYLNRDNITVADIDEVEDL